MRFIFVVSYFFLNSLGLFDIYKLMISLRVDLFDFIQYFIKLVINLLLGFQLSLVYVQLKLVYVK